MKYKKGDKVDIITKVHPEGTVGTIIRKLDDNTYLVGMTRECCSWNEVFTIDEIKPYEEPRWEQLLKIHLANKKLKSKRKNIGE